MIQEGDTILDRYKVAERIGQGGFGQTFKVNDQLEGSPKKKIIKVLDISTFNQEQQQKVIELFQREADVLKKLNHEGIPTVESDGYIRFRCLHTQEWLHGLVMEWIAGQNLKQWLGINVKATDEQCLYWLEQITVILDYLHYNNYVHRDIKPDNIMIKPNGKLVLIDFGAVKNLKQNLAQPSSLTTTPKGTPHTRIGTQGYTPPEQMEVYQERLPYQADFFALGRTFVELITGQSITQFKETLKTGRLLWKEKATHISQDMRELLDWMMEKNWRDRPKNTQEILKAINDIKKSDDVAYNFPLYISLALNFILLLIIITNFSLSSGWLVLLSITVVVITLWTVFKQFRLL